MSKKKQPSNEQLEITNKVYRLREISKNDDLLSELIGISKVTFYTRLKLSNWKVTEMSHINNIKI